jgi:hypothetical protein
MDAKLTLTIEQSIIERAKHYAKIKERSLSDLVENYFKMVTKEITSNEITLTPTVTTLKGSFYAPKHFNYKKEIAKMLADKYISNE